MGRLADPWRADQRQRLGARRSSAAGCAPRPAASTSLAYWVASDHFVELGEPAALFHGGFGLLTIGNLRKPRFWAIRILELLGERELAADDRAATARAVSSRPGRPATTDGRIAIAIWNGTLDQAKADGDVLPRSDRSS